MNVDEIEIRNPVAVVLRLKGVEVGRQPYDGIKPATWYASTIDFDEVVVETSTEKHSFQAPNGDVICGTGSDFTFPGDGYHDNWTSEIPLLPV